MGTIDKKLKYPFCIYGCGASLAKVIISNINDANQNLITLISSAREKGLFKTTRLVKRAFTNSEVEILELCNIMSKNTR